ncbi:AtpZ/AtpI family protein [Stappia sp. ES.058]|uniref:AtpZ/AtpI family protein n=1 Tax=Stappia sp. ES.058 TaxID=1881061 RepID=UPI0008794A37|nr:AtpZ/AtpI family protein [Stappia sp. ES.058]SDT92275.1 ATP synthase protein I [Stappia sp. ES.058]
MSPDESGQDGERRVFTEVELSERKNRLVQSLEERSPDAQRRKGEDSSGAGQGYAQAMKLSTEFVAGVLVGAGLGWLIDKGLGTSPWGLIIFLLLGFCAGVLNLLRSAGVVAEPEDKKRDDGS